MRIGLIRHFKVKYKPYKKWMNSEQFNQWVDEYNRSDVHTGDSGLNPQDWDICFSSDQYRAVRTAEHIYAGSILKSNHLREVNIHSALQLRIKLHYKLWLILGRVAWHFSHRSQSENRKETQLRARQVIDKMETYREANILIVSHGAFMKSLYKELVRRGYAGKGFIKPNNGKLYTYEKRYRRKEVT